MMALTWSRFVCSHSTSCVSDIRSELESSFSVLVWHDALIKERGVACDWEHRPHCGDTQCAR